ncbi:MAG: VWA domain-containing protein [Acidobacteria bacterium]|nr:VWA domain-containing protein [Acidobacteriota bacterium]
MKKVAASLLCLFVFGTFALAQSDIIIRPRIVPAPSPSRTIATGQTDLSTQNSNKRPPVINGNSGQSSDIKDNRTTSLPPVLTDGNSKGRTEASPQNEQPVTEEEDDGEIIKVETNLVTLPVSVLDRDGRFISGLEQRDFQIFDNGVQQKVEYFQSVESPFTVILLIDVSPSTEYHIDEIHEAAIGFVNQLRPEDKVMVVSFDENVHVLSPVTNDRKVLEEAILQAEFGSGTSLFEAVDFVINRELKQIEGRKAVVLFTDGVDTTSYRASYQTTVRDAQETDALIYPIRYDTYQPPQPQQTQPQQTQPQQQPQPQGGGSSSRTSVIIGGRNVLLGPATREEYETGRRYLEELARNSGGRTLEALNNLSGAFSNIAEELRRQYSIGYYPEKTGQKGERRQIRVRVMRQNVVVRTKSGYVVGAENKNLKGK